MGIKLQPTEMTLMCYLCVWVCMFLHEERPQVACVTDHLFFLRQIFSLNLEFTRLARLVSQGAAGVMAILLLAEFIAWYKQKTTDCLGKTTD